jgi:hypothetical protein
VSPNISAIPRGHSKALLRAVSAHITEAAAGSQAKTARCIRRSAASARILELIITATLRRAHCRRSAPPDRRVDHDRRLRRAWRVVLASGRGPVAHDGHEVFIPTMTGVGEGVHLLSPAVGLATMVQDVVALIESEAHRRRARRAQLRRAGRSGEALKARQKVRAGTHQGRHSATCEAEITPSFNSG